MVIVQGIFRVDPAERDAYLAQSLETMRASRAENGCLEYVFAADPVEDDRVILSERWASMDDLDEHLRGVNQRRQEAADRGDVPSVGFLTREIAVYEVSSAKQMT
jgi:quinol monooxygenase YgiN